MKNINMSKAVSLADISQTNCDSNCTLPLEMDQETSLSEKQIRYDQVSDRLKSVDNFNWAWQYRESENAEWQQFDCTDCLQLELNYQTLKLFGEERFKKVKIVNGIVDLEKNIMTTIQNKSMLEIQRTKVNTRKRRNAERRHDPLDFEGSRLSDNHFISDTNLQWTSVNYRKEKFANISPSRRRMVLIMYQKQPSYFPTLREIRDELIEAQKNEIQTSSHQWQSKEGVKYLIAEYQHNWKKLFKLANLDEDLDEPLTPKILSDPTHKAVRHILYLYSMESFIYEDLNRVCREKDISKIKYYGAFAAALSFIIHSANQNRLDDKLNNQTTLYRGVKMLPLDADKFEPGSKIDLLGYTSTSKKFSTALGFALKDLKEDKVSVVFMIDFKGSQGLFELTTGFSAYPNEQEVLVQDGLTYFVKDNSEEYDPKTGKKFR